MLEEVKDLFLLALGTKFSWENETYTITGYVIKQEKDDSTAVWVEYFLTHDSLPNLYLSCFNGHWTVIKYLPDIVRKKGSIRNKYNMTYKKVEYDFQHKYVALILDAQGCFNFPFYEDERNSVREFVDADEVLIWEENQKEDDIRFYMGQYIFASKLSKLLDPAVKLPKRIGLVAHQPFYFPLSARSFRLTSILLIACMLLGMFSWESAFQREFIEQGRLVVSSDNPNAMTSEPFEIKYDRSILNVQASVYYMSNDWVYAELALINTKTGEERYFEMEAEYYFGYEDGESWSEGSSTTDGNLQYVDAGTYVLEATPKQAQFSANKVIQFTLISQKGSWSIFWFLTGLIVVINIALGIIGDYFNHKKRGEDYDTFSDS